MSQFKASFMGLIAAWSLTADHHLRKLGQGFMILCIFSTYSVLFSFLLFFDNVYNALVAFIKQWLNLLKNKISCVRRLVVYDQVDVRKIAKNVYGE